MLAAIAVTASVLLGQSIGTNEPIDYRETISVHISHDLSDSFKGFYPWGSIDYGKGFLLGQSVSDLATFAGGVGYRSSISDRIEFRAEGGVAWPLHRSDHEIQQEIVYTYLVGRHESEFRPIPVYPTGPYDQDSYETNWQVDHGFYMRIGLTFEATEDLSVGLYYKYFQPRGLLEIWDEEGRAAGGGWWQEYRTIDMSQVQLGLGWRF